ncbi:MAG: hypothetical protein EOM83_07770 [Clostridia bacterium]|nr:hypothetical protein [Clostridia bacterium]
MKASLTNQDKKVLNYEKRMGYVFSGLVIIAGGFFTLFYFLLIKTEPNYLLVGLIDLGIILSAYFICSRVNRKLNRDLKAGEKEILKRAVEKKTEVKSHEAGSGKLYIPVLASLSPKLWGPKMNEANRYFIVVSDNKYEVDRGLYDDLKKGDDFYIHFARHSETILDFSKEG